MTKQESIPALLGSIATRMMTLVFMVYGTILMLGAVALQLKWYVPDPIDIQSCAMFAAGYAVSRIARRMGKKDGD